MPVFKLEKASVLEPDAAAMVDGKSNVAIEVAQVVALVSIAISLKRIADKGDANAVS